MLFKKDDVFVDEFSGGKLYMLLADRLILTHVDSPLGGGVPFPNVNPTEWQVTSQQDFPADTENAHCIRFVTYERLRPPSEPPVSTL